MTDKKKATPKGSTNNIPKKIIALKALMKRSLVQLGIKRVRVAYPYIPYLQYSFVDSCNLSTHIPASND